MFKSVLSNVDCHVGGLLAMTENNNLLRPDVRCGLGLPVGLGCLGLG